MFGISNNSESANLEIEVVGSVSEDGNEGAIKELKKLSFEIYVSLRLVIV